MENENEIQNSSENEGTPKKLSYEELEAELKNARGELKNVRGEAASRRVELRDMKAKADDWDKYQESQKTELQKLQDALKERDEKLSVYVLADTKKSVAKEFGLAAGDEDLLVGSDEASLRAHAEKLKARLGQAEKPNVTDLLAGNRGTPVGSSESNFNADSMIRRMAGR